MARKTILRMDTAQPFKFENLGDKLSGYYLKTESVVIDGRNVDKHYFKTAEGLKSVLGQYDLGKQLKEMGPGFNVDATLISVQKLKGGKTLKVYEVSYDDEDRTADEIAAPKAVEAVGDDTPDEDLFEEEAPLDTVKTPKAANTRAFNSTPTSQAKINELLGKTKRTA